MVALKKRSEENIEELILTGLIVSNEFYQKVRNCVRVELFDNSYTQRVAEWCIDYFEENGQVPFFTITHIFESSKPDLSRDEIMVIGALFQKISNIYEDSEENDSLNAGYLANKVAIPYFEKREVVLKANKALGFIAQNDIESAKELFDTPIRVKDSTVEIIAPFEDASLVEEAIFTRTESVIELPGALGAVMGPQQLGWFVNLQGAPKRGKSNFLYDIAFFACAGNLPVLHVSMEMQKKDSIVKWAKRITAGVDNPGVKVLPVFDCKLNQDGSCEKFQRPDQPPLLTKKGKLPRYDIDHPHIPCTFCRSANHIYTEFQPSSWFEPISRNFLGTNKNLKLIQSFHKYHGHNLRSVTYPKFSVSLLDILRDIDNYALSTGWMPKVLCIDYLDVTKLLQSGRRSDTRDPFDTTWKRAAGEAQERNILLYTVSQSNRTGVDKVSQDEQDISEDMRKIAHVDLWLALNQLPSEKRKMSARIGIVGHRHYEFDKGRQAMVLQDIGAGQFCLDSELVYMEDE